MKDYKLLINSGSRQYEIVALDMRTVPRVRRFLRCYTKAIFRPHSFEGQRFYVTLRHWTETGRWSVRDAIVILLRR